jgi:hypothetical protein
MPNRTRQRPLRRRAALGWLMVAALLGLTAAGATIQGVRFADSRQAGDLTLKLVGTGLQRYAYVYHVCVAALYLPAGTKPTDALTNVPKTLEIEYFHNIRADQFATLTVKGVKANTPPAEFARVEARLRDFVAAYQDVRPGDRYALTFLPGAGTTLALNGKTVIQIPGDDFARALYSVWLGREPVTEGLKAGLLGKP